MVLPLPPKTGGPVRLLPEAELDWKAQRGSGPGGQHRNKTDSAVRMTHRPTGLTVFIDGRSQHQNYDTARRILSVKAAELRDAATQAGYDSHRRRQWTGASRGTKVRTYNFIDSRVVDHRTGAKTTRVADVMRGRLELVLNAT